MFSPKPARPYFDSWLRRTGRQFAVSGRLTQTAVALAAEDGGSVDEWRSRLRCLLGGNDVPSLDLLTKIDALLAAPSKISSCGDFQGTLF